MAKWHSGAPHPARKGLSNTGIYGIIIPQEIAEMPAILKNGIDGLQIHITDRM